MYVLFDLFSHLFRSAIHTDSGLDIVSGAEDGSVMVWSGTEKVQFIPHPSCVWCVMGLPNTGGDFLTGSHDGVLRLFSRNPDKYNSTSAVQAHLEFAMEVSAAKEQKRKGPTNEEIAKAPKWENRGALPGTSENQVMVFNDKGTMIAAQWNSGSWIMVGNVTGTGDGGSINGVYYDHVMPVEIETPNGLRNLNLGHNNGENPFDAAQRFIDQNELSQGYLQQIADWIIARSGQSAPTLGMDDSSTKMDVQSSYSAPKAFSFRSDGYFAYDDIPQTNKVYGKVVEFNGSMEGNNKLSDRNLELLSSLITVLENKSHYVTSEVSKEHIIAVLAMVNWDIDKLFPMFDLFRLIAVHPKGSSTLSSIPQLSVVINKIAKLSRQREAFTTASALTASKFLVNLFRNDELRNTVLRNNLLSQTVLDIVNTLVLHSSKLVRLAVSTFILNLSTVTSHYGLFSLRLSIEMMDSVFSNASQLLQYENDSVETIFRALKAVGTMKFNLESEMDIYSSRYNLSSILFATKDKWSNTGKMDEVVLSCLNEVSVLFP